MENITLSPNFQIVVFFNTEFTENHRGTQSFSEVKLCVTPCSLC
jgi:hypothetical protein